MNGLLTKEWFLFRNNIIVLLLFTVLISLLALTDGGYMTVILLPVVLGLYPGSFMTLDETSKWQQYSLTMPYGRKKIVSSKYTMTLLILLFALIISAAVMFISMTMHDNFVKEKFCYTLGFAAVFSMVVPAIIIPLNFKFGTAVGRIVMVIMGALTGASMNVFAEKIIPKVYKFFLRYDMLRISLIALGAIAVLYALSWVISIMIFEHKDL